MSSQSAMAPRAAGDGKARHVVMIALAQINWGASYQVRERLDTKVVDEYATMMEDGVSFDPIVVFVLVDETNNGTEEIKAESELAYIVTDGHHRVGATRQIGRKEILAEVRYGTAVEAETFAIGANVKVRKKLSDAEKRRNAERLMDLHPTWSNRKIAKGSGASHQTVGRIKKGREPVIELPESGPWTTHSNITSPDHTTNHTSQPTTTQESNSTPVQSQAQVTPLLVPQAGDDEALKALDAQLEAGDDDGFDDIPWDAWEPVEDAREGEEVDDPFVNPFAEEGDDLVDEGPPPTQEEIDALPLKDWTTALLSVPGRILGHMPLIEVRYIGANINDWILEGGLARVEEAATIAAADNGRAKLLSPKGAWEHILSYTERHGYALEECGGGAWSLDLPHLEGNFGFYLVEPGVDAECPGGAWDPDDDGSDKPLVSLVRIMRLLCPPRSEEGDDQEEGAAVASAPAPTPPIEEEVEELEGWRVGDVGRLVQGVGVHPKGTRAEVESFEGGRIVVKLNGRGERMRVKPSAIERAAVVPAIPPAPIKAWEVPALVERPAEQEGMGVAPPPGTRIVLTRSLGASPRHAAMEAGRLGVVGEDGGDGYVWVTWDGDADVPTRHFPCDLEEVAEAEESAEESVEDWAKRQVAGVMTEVDHSLDMAQRILADMMDGRQVGDAGHWHMVRGLNKIKDLREMRRSQEA